MVGNSKTITLVSSYPPRGLFAKACAPTLLDKFPGSSLFSYAIYFPFFIPVGICYSYNLFNE